ncbi:MAG: amidohydrolase [Candidatus Moduliflexus flocculans]|nr:amidohydrolase [Candidatus Moduliflexus flocculans]
MRKHLPKTAAALAGLLIASQLAAGASVKKKEEAVASIEKHKAEIIALSDQVWAFAETALLEVRSAEALAAYAEKQGFQVERGLAGMPTAFVASYGEGRPVIGILGEYDALPGLSQKALASKELLEAGAPGHGCGHNLLGTAALGAALAIKDLMAAGKLKGTIRFYGTPAEEAVGGKIYMVRDGVFKDLDVCLNWHPGDKTQVAVDSSQAIIDFIVEFSGRTAHAAADPWNGRSAVAALEFFTTGLNRMREFVRPTVRMHYSILEGGDVPNVVPAYAKLWCWLRDSKGPASSTCSRASARSPRARRSWPSPRPRSRSKAETGRRWSTWPGRRSCSRTWSGSARSRSRRKSRSSPRRSSGPRASSPKALTARSSLGRPRSPTPRADRRTSATSAGSCPCWA